ncbi:hypothetical protein D0Z70_05950 [Sphingobium terrigena]|uniref:Uncharacterized protein n=2 Tax=Sphingobium terrigena TaxID=2304063 RepID=A0A418YVE2_9SPHN|nr:hypothetical protein D0Z70_05950 [Sphingobium terrigena]
MRPVRRQPCVHGGAALLYIYASAIVSPLLAIDFASEHAAFYIPATGSIGGFHILLLIPPAAAALLVRNN